MVLTKEAIVLFVNMMIIKSLKLIEHYSFKLIYFLNKNAIFYKYI